MLAACASRRATLLERLPKNACAVLFSGREERRNADNHHRFRQSSDFLYLTGMTEPESVAVFTPGKDRRFTLLCRPRDKFAELWYGHRAGLEGATELYGADQSFAISELERRLLELLDGCDEVHYLIGDRPEHDELIGKTIARLRRNERNGSRAPSRIVDLKNTLHEMRLVKDEAAILSMRRSCTVTVEAHLLAMRACSAGKREYEIEALVDYGFRRRNGLPGYQSIIAAGKNATVLHYVDNQDQLEPGQLLLVDAGCELDGFTGDVTRTYPIAAPGHRAQFSREQRQLYDIVLDAQLAAIAAVRPGVTVEELHTLICHRLASGLCALGLLSGDPASAVESGALKRFYPHRSSHFLGLDVHDVGRYFPDGEARQLLPGTVFTIEPGLYVQPDDPLGPEWRGIGIRIEDDILITTTGHEVLTADLPKRPDEVLKLASTGVNLLV
ncbi:MAG TPA: aminopeptidase P N-terminal domain-containing protein [Pseudomonadota bacterium]|nr:aminopeptidase P N-terminal domain-containing protein [Pseudomonadota bacterium]